MLGALKRLFVGRPLATTQMEEQRLPKTIALGGVLLRRVVVDRVRDRGDPLRHRAGRVEPRARPEQAGADRDRRVRPARDRDRVLPPGDLRLPERRRRVRREPREHRRVRGAGRGRLADGRLRADRGGVDLGRRRRDHLDPGVLRPGRPTGPARRRADRAHHAGQHARDQGVGAHLRHPDLRLHADPRGRSSSSASPRRSSATARRCRSTPRPSTARSRAAARWASSCCSRGSRRARSRSPAWRRSRTASPRSVARSRRTPPPRWCGWGCCSARCSSACRYWRTTSSRTRATTAR